VASVNAALANVQQIDLCVHLAARAGVRPSLTNPQLYIDTNVHGTRHVIEHCERKGCRAFVYASSSSVYGSQPSELPFTEDIPLCPPESPYAQTKVDNEVFASRFANEHENLCLAGLRFFTVDGPMLCGVPGRPDMAIASFIRMIASGTAVTMYGDGSYKRDFSFVQDIVQGIVKSAEWCENVSNQTGRHEVFNLGEEDCTSVHDVILMLASEMGVKFDGTMEGLIRKGVVTSVPPPKGDVPHTHANVSKARRLLGYDPHCKIAENIRRTVRAMHSVPWLPSQVTHVLRSLRDSSIVIAPEEAMSVLRERCEVEPDVSLWPILLEHFAQR
jgi:UDP-glucuronate 4-epimerase